MPQALIAPAVAASHYCLRRCRQPYAMLISILIFFDDFAAIRHADTSRLFSPQRHADYAADFLPATITALRCRHRRNGHHHSVTSIAMIAAVIFRRYADARRFQILRR